MAERSPLFMSFIGTLVLAMIVCDFVWWWQADRLARRWRWLRMIVAAFSAAQIAGLLLFILTRAIPGAGEPVLGTPLLSLVYLWHCLVLLPVTFAAVVSGVASLAVRGIRLIFARRKAAQVPEAEGAISRRDFIRATFAVAPAFVTVAAATIALPQLQRFRIRRLTIALPQLPPGLDGLTIAHVSDLHVGRFTHGAVLSAIVRATNDLRPDLVLLTGDLINYALSDLPAALEIVKQLRGAHGVFLCEGNHDLIENGALFEERTRASGVPLLVNESAQVQVRGVAVQILGLRWGSGRRSGPRQQEHGDQAIASSMRELLELRRRAAFPMLLAHHPHAFDFAEDLPLTLAGHTHGGQLMLNEQTGFGPVLFRYWSGLYRHGERAMVVSNGVGNWFPLRTRAPAEIIHLTLRRG